MDFVVFSNIIFWLSIIYLISMSIYGSVFLYQFVLNDFKYKNKSFPYKRMLIFSILGIIITQVIREFSAYYHPWAVHYYDISSNQFYATLISFAFNSVFVIIAIFSLLLIFFKKHQDFMVKHDKIVAITICVIFYIIGIVVLMFISYEIPIIIRNLCSYDLPHYEIWDTIN